jgi:hypothetical protein
MIPHRQYLADASVPTFFFRLGACWPLKTRPDCTIRARPEIIPTSKIEKCRDIGKIELRSTQLFLYGPLAFRVQTKTPLRWTYPAARNGTFWEVIYGSAFRCFSSGGVRDVFRGA